MRALLLLHLAAVATAVAAAAADQTPRFVSLLTASPPQVDAATALCERGALRHRAPGDALVLAAPPGAPVTSAELADYLVALLPRHPTAIETLACAVAQDAIDAPARPDGGAGLLAVAAAKKHMKLAAALLKQGASLRLVAPRDAGGAGLAHAALSARLLAVDVAAKVLKAASVAAASIAAAAPAAAPPPAASGGVSAWLQGIGRALERHLTAVSPADAARVQGAIARLTATAGGAGPPTVYASDLAALSNGLSTLLLRILLSAAAEPPRETSMGGGGGAGAAAVTAAGSVVAATAAAAVAADCAPLARARALHAAWARAPRVALLVSADRYGRTPLHIAAAHDNALAGVLLLRSLADAVGAQGAGPLGHPLSLDGCHHRSDEGVDVDGAPPPPTRPALQLLSGARRGAVAVEQYLAARDSLGATALELACAHGHGGFAAALHAVAASLGVRAGGGGGGGGGGGDGGGHDDDGSPAAVCAPVLRRLNATRPNARTVGGGGWAGGAGGSPPLPPIGSAPWVGHRQKGAADAAVPPAIAAAGGGWAAADSKAAAAALPREAARAVRAARKRLIDRLWAAQPALAAAGGKAPSVNTPAAVAAFRDHCDVEVVDFAAAASANLSVGAEEDTALTPAGFLRAFAHASRPVLLRGLAARWGLRTAWTRDALLAAGANVPVTASRIPYEHAFVVPPPGGGAAGGGTSAGGGAVRLSLADYVRAMSECGGGTGSGGTRVASGESSDRGAALPMDPTLCARLGYSQPAADGAPTAAAAAAAAAGVATPLYVFDVIAKAKSDTEAARERDNPWALLSPTPPTAVPNCTVGCGRTLNAAMQREWFHDPQQGRLLQSVDFQLPFLNTLVPVDARAPSSVPQAALRQVAAEEAAAAAARLVGGAGGAAPGAPRGGGGGGGRAQAASAPHHLGHGHAGDPELEASTREAAEHDVAMLASPLPHPQFFVGPAGAGSPPHWHKSAANVLAWGQKRWAILPPSASVYSATPASTWWTRELPHVGAGCGGPSPPSACAAAPVQPLECTQNAGDVLFVPPAWGHAVLNTEASVGIAIEFTTPLSR